VPTFDGSDDLVWVGGPDEGPGVDVCLGEEAVDGGLEVDDGSEDATFEAPAGELGKIAFDGVEPARRGRCEMEDEAGMATEPGVHLGMLVGGVVVEDDVDNLAGGDLGLDEVEEAYELLVAVALHAAADDLAVEHVQRGEQGGGAMALVVVGHGGEPTLLDRQAGLGAIEGLDLALLVERQHDGMGRRIDIETDDVSELGGKLRVVGQLEAAEAVGCQAVRPPDALHRGDADAGRPGHGGTGPVGRLAGRFTQRQGDHLLDDRVGQRWHARRPGLVAQQPLDAFLGEALLPAPDRRLGDAGLAHDGVGAQARGGEQHDPAAPDVLLRSVAVRDDRLEAGSVVGADGKADPGAHPADSHDRIRAGILSGTLMSDFIH